MDDFLKRSEDLKKYISDDIAIAAGSPDNINLSKFFEEATKLAEQAFREKALSPCQVMARKDAYDFVKAQTRCADITLRSRAFYYDNAKNELQVHSNRNEFNKAALLTLEKIS